MNILVEFLLRIRVKSDENPGQSPGVNPAKISAKNPGKNPDERPGVISKLKVPITDLPFNPIGPFYPVGPFYPILSDFSQFFSSFFLICSISF